MTDIGTDRQIDIGTGRHRDRQIDRQTERQADIGTDGPYQKDNILNLFYLLFLNENEGEYPDFFLCLQGRSSLSLNR